MKVGSFQQIPVQLDASCRSDFEQQFMSALATEEANISQIIYRWFTKRPVPRVRGESNLIYIGQSDTSFRRRYNNTKAFRCEGDAFENRYKYMIELYGPITIEIAESDSPKDDEHAALLGYFKKHRELPPVNLNWSRSVSGVVDE